jgi:signal transduction histidine kinase
MPVVRPTPPDLVDRLSAFNSLSGVPRSEIQWLVASGELRHFARGEIILRKGDETRQMVIVLTGRIVVTFEQGTGHRHAIENTAGSMTGLLPYSRLARALGDVVSEEETDGLVIDRDQLPELIRECPAITTRLVHTMVDRARMFAGIDWQDEKLLSLGRLAAGLAHELDNPASAAARSARLLPPTLRELGDAAFAVSAALPTPEQRALIAALVDQSLGAPIADVRSPLERSAREEALANWLETHGADTAAAAALAEHGLTIADLDRLAGALTNTLLDAALRWIGAANTSAELAGNVERSTNRIHELVSAVKRFTYVDRGGAAEPTDVGRALGDTVAVLAAKAREKSIRVTLDIAPDLPLVSANSAALNQVWSNLLENALDAAPRSGAVVVDAARQDGAVVVRVIDDGPGIPPDVREHLFDPFFTTKDVGTGTGLGLSIAYGIVRDHGGWIDVKSAPGEGSTISIHLPLEADPT